MHTAHENPEEQDHSRLPGAPISLLQMTSVQHPFPVKTPFSARRLGRLSARPGHLAPPLVPSPTTSAEAGPPPSDPGTALGSYVLEGHQGLLEVLGSGRASPLTAQRALVEEVKIKGVRVRAAHPTLYSGSQNLGGRLHAHGHEAK